MHKNSFTPLMIFSMECYKCHNYGHTEKFYKRKSVNSSKINEKDSKISDPTVKVNNNTIKKVWKKKYNNANESLICQVAVKAENKPIPWIIDSSCRKDMTGDKHNYYNIQKYEVRSVKFGNNYGEKIIVKGTMKIGNGKMKSEEVLFVIGLRHNLLSVSKICDKGNDFIFKRHGCEIRR